MAEPAASRLRALLARPGLLCLPGCYDALSARLVEAAGYPAAYVTGFGTAAAAFGLPDTGLVGFREMLDHAAAMAAAVSLPLVADADTGYGNEMNVYRTVRANQRAGLAGIQIEDQVWPKRCGHVDGQAVVDLDEARRRIRAAVDARAAGDIVLVARTDARQTLGFEAALERCHAFAEEGADVVFLEAPESRAELERLADEVDAPLLVNLIEGGKTPILPASELERLGFKIAIHPLTLLRVVTGALQSHLARGDAPHDFAPYEGAPSFDELKEIVGFGDYDRRLERYRSADPGPG